jgi:tRNA(fMet)-specific endonuclease VapC
MKGYILDTDTWIEYFHHRGGVDKYIAETPVEQIFASEVSIAELTYGALHSSAVEKHLQEPKMIEESFTVLPIYEGWAKTYAEIRQALASQGLIVGDLDILIAVTARHEGLTVVTHNTKHFSKMSGITCVDWVEKEYRRS